MRPIEQLLGTMLETWNQRYNFRLERETGVLVFSVPGFELTAVEHEGAIALSFEEEGKRYRKICPLEEAPSVIEASLFPE